MRILLIVIAVLFPLVASSYSEFYKEHKRGWFWYEEAKKASKEEEESHNKLEKNGIEKLEDLQKEFEEAKAQMIVNPSVANARRYIGQQKKMFLRADLVSKYWKEAMFIYPELDVSRGLPISAEGAKISAKLQEMRAQTSIGDFAKKYKLLFFYKKSCPYCEGFAKVLKVFAARYSFSVAAVSLDGAVMEGFEHLPRGSLIEKFNVNYAPSLFVYSNDVAIPISEGFLAIDELEARVAYIAGMR